MITVHTVEQINIAALLAEMAARRPHQAAVILPAGTERDGRPRYTRYSFAELDQRVDQYAQGFTRAGIERGERTLMLVRPGVDLIAVAFALLKIGAVPVIIDPGMGRKAFLQCVAETEPTALVGIELAHIMRAIFRGPFGTVKKAVTAGRRLGWGGTTLAAMRTLAVEPFAAVPVQPRDEAVIAFTSGSTGIPKGVVLEHGILREQVRLLGTQLDMREGDVHLVVFLSFALFNPALGITSLLADIDPRSPATVDAARLAQDIASHGATLTLGSPTIWRRLARHCRDEGIKLPSLRTVLMFGAAVPPDLIEAFAPLLPNGTVHTPYGATEALPLTDIAEEELLATAPDTRAGRGVCVGRPLGDARLCVIPISDEPIERWDESLALPPGEIGEIVARGTVVTRSYLHRPQQTAAAKMRDADGNVWHRMGDIGYMDEGGRLWACGRKSHRVETSSEPSGLLLPIQCEAIFNEHPAVARTALVGVGKQPNQTPVLVVEMEVGHAESDAERRTVARALLERGASNPVTETIRTVLFHPGFPVDVRHNAKIKRELLSIWAAKQLGVSI